MIAVKIFWSTHPDGTPVNYETVDWDAEEAPVSIYGPFDSLTAAISWMETDYPDDDTDVHDMVADDFDIPDDWSINDPATIKDGSNFDPVHPDVDIRDESREIHTL